MHSSFDPRAGMGKTKQQLADELLAVIIDIANDAIVSSDEDHRITLFNQGAEQLFGYRAQEVIGAPLETLLPKQFRRAHSHHLKSFSAADNGSRLMNDRNDILGLKKDGSTFPARASISRLEHDGGY